MSEERIKDRPYPFEVKTRILQLVGLSISTPKEIADINLDLRMAWGSVEVSVYVGGYDSNRSDPENFTESLYLDHHTEAVAVEKLDSLIARISAATANGRKVRAKRLRDQAAELLQQAEEVENRAAEELCSGSTQTSEKT